VSIVMKIGPKDSVGERAKQALWKVDRNGQSPKGWTFGRDVWNRLRRDTTIECETFFGLPFVVKRSAPPDLLELEASF
jgi:hypothetical protein